MDGISPGHTGDGRLGGRLNIPSQVYSGSSFSLDASLGLVLDDIGLFLVLVSLWARLIMGPAWPILTIIVMDYKLSKSRNVMGAACTNDQTTRLTILHKYYEYQGISYQSVYFQEF